MNYLLLVKQRFWMILTYEFETNLWLIFLWLIQKNQLEVFCSWIGLYGSRLCVCWIKETLVYALDIWQKCIQSHLDCRQWQKDLKRFNCLFFCLHFWQCSSLFGDLFLAWRWTVPRNGVCVSDLHFHSSLTSAGSHTQPVTQITPYTLLQHLTVYY